MPLVSKCHATISSGPDRTEIAKIFTASSSQKISFTNCSSQLPETGSISSPTLELVRFGLECHGMTSKPHEMSWPGINPSPQKMFVWFIIEGFKTQHGLTHSMPKILNFVSWVYLIEPNHMVSMTCIEQLKSCMKLIQLGNQSRTKP